MKFKIAFALLGASCFLRATAQTIVTNPTSSQTITQPSGTTFTASSLRTTVDPTTFPGNDACAKINAAIASLPQGGGVVDASGFGAGTQTVNTTCQTSTKSDGSLRISLIFNPSTVFVPGSPGMNVLDVYPNTIVTGFTANTTSLSYTGNAIELPWNYTGNNNQLTKLTNFHLNGTNGQGNGLYLAPPANQGVAFIVITDGSITGFANGVDLNATAGFINGNVFRNLNVTNATTCLFLNAANGTTQAIQENSFGVQCEAGTYGLKGTYVEWNDFTGFGAWDYSGSGQSYYSLDINSYANTFSYGVTPGPNYSAAVNFAAGLSQTGYVAGSTYDNCESGPGYNFWWDSNTGIGHPAAGQVNICAPNGATFSGSTTVKGNLQVGGGVPISSTSSIPQVESPASGHVACIKSSGPPVVLGYCSSAVLSDGSCTCN